MRLVVFDLDGTLIDSRQDLADSANALIVERGGRPLPVEAVTGMVGEGAAVLVRRALTAAGLEPEIEAALPRFLELYDDRLLVHTAVYPGTRETLTALAPVTRLAILTNKPQQPTEKILAGLGIHQFFFLVLGGDTPFGRKPDPAGLRHLVGAAGVSAREAVLVGDSAIDLRTARAADVPICLVRYGFGFPLVADELRGDDRIADSPASLLDLLAP